MFDLATRCDPAIAAACDVGVGMILRPRKIVDLRAGGAHSNAGLSLKQAYDGLERLDPRIESLILALFAVPYRLS